MSKEVKDVINKKHFNNLLRIFKAELNDARYYDWDTVEYLQEVVYLLENMTNLQMALYDENSLQLAAKVIAEHLCFDDTTGTLIPFDKSSCIGCMFSPTLEEGADGVDCPDKFRPWLCKKITE